MKNRQLLLSAMLFVIGFIFSACGGGGGGGSNTGGFSLRADRIEISQTTQSQITVPTTMRVTGHFIEPLGTIRGTLETIPITEFTNFQYFSDMKVPAKWQFTYAEVNQFGRIPCQDGVQTVVRNVQIGEVEPLSCHVTVFPLAIAPNAVDVNLPPANIIISLEGASDEFGLPQIAIFDQFGQLKATAPATILSGKPKVQFATPNLSNYSNGVYSISVNNVLEDGRWDVVGTGELSIYGNQPPPIPNPPQDPCVIPGTANRRPDCQF